MDSPQTFAEGLEIGAVFLNLIQKIGIAQRPTSHGDLSAMTPGVEARIFQATSDLNTGTLITVCNRTIQVVDPLSDPIVLTTTSGDTWTDRHILGVYRPMGGAGELAGGASDHLFDAGALSLWCGYTGLGAYDAGGTNPPSAGNPPSRAMGASWACEVVSNLWLYVDPSDGFLKLYNDTGSTIRCPFLWFFAAGKAGKR
jgi:hypothetical protein